VFFFPFFQNSPPLSPTLILSVGACVRTRACLFLSVFVFFSLLRTTTKKPSVSSKNENKIKVAKRKKTRLSQHSIKAELDSFFLFFLTREWEINKQKGTVLRRKKNVDLEKEEEKRGKERKGKKKKNRGERPSTLLPFTFASITLSLSLSHAPE